MLVDELRFEAEMATVRRLAASTPHVPAQLRDRPRRVRAVVKWCRNALHVPARRSSPAPARSPHVLT